ncbi:right-handed parallel beta-helix repeat-containing protein [Candidatus Acetothermia bacterium]|nr:right-handed parallel beta-helix repeat-containing protein [Candidatus Acetothermia bacterium]
MPHRILQPTQASSWRRIVVLGLVLASILTLTASFSGAKPVKQINAALAGNSPRELRVPQDFPTIQKAVEAAQPGDLITIAEGVYREYVTITKPLTLQTDRSNYVLIVNPPDFKPRSTVLICNAQGVVLSGLKVTHNAIPPWAAIAVEAGPPGSLTAMTLKQVHAFGAHGGGIRMGFATLEDELPRECRPSGSRGRVDVTISDSLLDGNPWAGIYVEGGIAPESTLTVENSSIVRNGMGIGSLSGGARLAGLTVQHSMIAENKNVGGGLASLGALRVEKLILQDNAIIRNSSGVYVSAGSAELQRNLIWQNEGVGVLIDAPAFRPSIFDLRDNIIRENVGCGVQLQIIPNVIPRVTGSNNEIAGNQAGDLCPADFAWPEGFKK